MEHERAPSPERIDENEPHKPVFDLEQLEPDQVAGLVAILGKAFEAEVGGTAEALFEAIGSDLRNTARDSDKAMDIYASLMRYPTSSFPLELAAENMAATLLRRHLNDPDARQQIIDPWVSLMHHEDHDVSYIARNSIWTALSADWLDEPTKRYLKSQYPEER